MLAKKKNNYMNACKKNMVRIQAVKICH